MVDKVFGRTDFDLYDRDFGYPKMLMSIDVVIFDKHGTRMLLRLTGDHMFRRFANILREGSSYRIHNFTVLNGGEGFHMHNHITLTPKSVVRPFNAFIPRFNFQLMGIKDIMAEWSPGHKVRDVCGLLINMGVLDWGSEEGYYTRCLSFVIQDKDGKRIKVSLKGESALVAWVDFQHFSRLQRLVVAVQFALVSRTQGVSSLKNYCAATRVIWNPTMPELMTVRGALLRKRSRG